MKNLISSIEPPCPKCPYALGLVRTTVSPCPQCRADNYQAYKHFKKSTESTIEQI